MTDKPFITSFPTRLHKEAAAAISAHFLGSTKVDTVLLVNSCARGQAVADSDLDLAILVTPGVTMAEMQELDSAWKEFAQTAPAVTAYRSSGPHAHLHLDLITGDYQPGQMEDGGMPDHFEIEIGNQVGYSSPLGEAGPFFAALQRKWLPYYDGTLRSDRLEMTRQSCEYDISCIPRYLERGLYFHAFDRLTVAFQKYLQALFISKGVYPIAYNKWIRMQVETWLDMPDLYPRLAPILSVSNIESLETAEKAGSLRGLLQSI